MCGTKVLVRNDGIVMTEVQFSLSGHRISRPGLDGAPPQSPRGIHRSRGPVMSSPIRPGKVTWPRAPSRSRHFPTPSGPTAQTRSPPPPRRCPRRPESLREVRSRLQPTVHVHTAVHDHGLVVVDPLDLFHRQHPTSRPASDRPAPMVRAISPVDPCSVAKATSARRGGKLDGDAVSMAPQRGIRTTSGRAQRPSIKSRWARSHDIVRCGVSSKNRRVAAGPADGLGGEVGP